MLSKLFLAGAFVAVAVNAQTIPDCVLACVIPAATLNGCTFTDVACVCGSAQFAIDATACLTDHCDAADIATAQSLQQTQCTAAGVTPSGTTTTPRSVSFTLASSSTGAASSSGPAATTAASSTHTTPASSSTHTTPATSAPAATSSKASASGLVAQGGAGAIIGAVLAGVLAL